MFWIVVVTILIIWIVFYIYYRNLKKLFKKQENIIKGTIIQKEYANPFIKKHILTVKINENEEENIIKTNYYGSALSVPASGNEIKLVKCKNNKYENNYNFCNLKMYYISTTIGVPVAIVIAFILKYFLLK